MKQAFFILAYGLVVACVGFTVVTVFSLPTAFSGVFAVPAVMLANRVGSGFGVQLFPPRETAQEERVGPVTG